MDQDKSPSAPTNSTLATVLPETLPFLSVHVNWPSKISQSVNYAPCAREGDTALERSKQPPNGCWSADKTAVGRMAQEALGFPGDGGMLGF